MRSPGQKNRLRLADARKSCPENRQKANHSVRPTFVDGRQVEFSQMYQSDLDLLCSFFFFRSRPSQRGPRTTESGQENVNPERQFEDNVFNPVYLDTGRIT